MRYIIILSLLFASTGVRSQKVSYPQYEILNDTVNYILDHDVLTEDKDYYKGKHAKIFMCQEDSATYLLVSLEENVVYRFSADSIKGYVHHDKVNILLWREPMKGFFMPSKEQKPLTVTCLDGGNPPDGGEEWKYVIYRKSKKVYRVYHITGW